MRKSKLIEGKKIPAVVAIELVNYCNCNYIFCPLFQGQDQIDRKIRPKAAMSIEIFKKIVTEIASWQVAPEVIYLNTHGEPYNTV